MVEDLYVEARKEYRIHRALALPGVRRVPGRGGLRPGPRRRYLGRAVLLDPAPERRIALARVRLAANARGRRRWSCCCRWPGRRPPALLEQAVDALGLASAQVEIDRIRFRRCRAWFQWTDRSACPRRRALSSGGPLRFEAEPVVLYVGSSACQTCSADMQALKRAATGARVVLWPEDPGATRPSARS